MQDNRQKRPYKKIRREDMDVPGCATAVKVVNGRYGHFEKYFA